MSALRNLPSLAEEYLRMREGLLRDHPELADDAHALADTLDGISDATEVVAVLLRGSREDAANAKALGEIMDEMATRKERHLARAERRREAAQRFMEKLERRSVTFPDFTASIRPGGRSVVLTNPKAIPDDLCRIKREPDKAAIKDAIEEGREVPGAFLSNGGEILAIRFK